MDGVSSSCSSSTTTSASVTMSANTEDKFDATFDGLDEAEILALLAREGDEGGLHGVGGVGQAEISMSDGTEEFDGFELNPTDLALLDTIDDESDAFELNPSAPLDTIDDEFDDFELNPSDMALLDAIDEFGDFDAFGELSEIEIAMLDEEPATHEVGIEA